jgi:hypothetical protein
MELQRNEKGFYFFEFVAGSHDHIRTRVWVNKSFVNFVPCPHRGRETETSPEWLREATERDLTCYKCEVRYQIKELKIVHPDEGEVPNELKFPIQGAQVFRTEKGVLVLRPSGEGWVALVQERSGYRGSADFSLEGDFEIVAEGKEFHSPQGNLGETAWALVNVKSPELVVHASITGRRVAQGEYSYKLFPDGRIENLEEEGLEQLLE